MPLSNTLTLKEVIEFATALLGIDNGSGNNLILTKDGKALNGNTLQDAGVINGDLLVVLAKRSPGSQQRQQQQERAEFSSGTPASAAGGGLDFSNLFGAAAAAASGGGGGGNSSTSLLPPGAAALINDNPTPFYYEGMTLEDAMKSNPHPKAFVKLLQTHTHLFKALNYHSPVLASKLLNQPYEKAVQVWREEMVKGSIEGAAQMSQTFHKEKNMKERLQRNPNDEEAKLYFEAKKSKELVNEQYMQAMQEYPESMGRVLMLYVDAKINNHPLQAFVDSGAQMTIMSAKCAKRCEIFHLLDTRFHGVAVGVGQGKILGMPESLFFFLLPKNIFQYIIIVANIFSFSSLPPLLLLHPFFCRTNPYCSTSNW
jgi:hypothetical protein